MDVYTQRLDAWLRAVMPFVFTVILTVLSVSAWPLPYLGAVMPPLGFISLYYWSAHRPDLFPSSAAFCVGFLHDIVNGITPGVSALLFTVAHQIIWRQSRVFIGHSFWTFWAGFAVSASMMMIFQWMVLAVLDWTLLPVMPLLVQTALAIVVFPLPCWGMIQLQRRLLSTS